MIAVLGYKKADIHDLKLRELYRLYERRIIHDWDLTSFITTAVLNVATTNIRIHTKGKPKGAEFTKVHPYRKFEPTHKIHDITILKDVFNAVMKQR